jgi:hypothetical protein
MAGASRVAISSPEALRAKHFTVLVGVGEQPGHEESGAQRGRFLVGDFLVHRGRTDLVAELGVAVDLEFRVGRHDAAVSGVVEKRGGIVGDLDGGAAALADSFELRRRHRPGLQHHRW